jgi:uncharacterized Zn ribbon protein
MKITVSAPIKSSVENAFDAFLNVQSAKEFMFRTDTGSVAEASVEAEIGGSFLFSEKRGDQLASHYGTFVEIERPEKISFTFAVEKDADGDFVEVFFKPTSSGCDVTFIHEIKPEYAEWKSKIEKGWTTILEKLNAYLSAKTALASQPKDSNGQTLNEGDSVKTIKDLKVKGSSMVVKRGTIIKNIHLISGNDEEIDCKLDGVALALETQWLVRV